MHEFTLARDILQLAREAAEQHQLAVIVAVQLKVGSLAGVDTGALQFAWEYLRSEASLTQAAQLNIEPVAAHGECQLCGYTGEPMGWFRICPKCGEGKLHLTSGEEFMVTEVCGLTAAEVETTGGEHACKA